jgi:P-type Ca2+ transporter type 2C
VNDAPALKKADIGIAMGITGTDVAKEASDMVLLDDKFSTIIAAIEEGRGIFHNIRKFVVYLLSCNIAEVIVVFVGVVVLQELILTATILLWINVVTDGIPAVALGLDPAEKGILRYPPKVFQSEIISKRLWVEMTLCGILIAGMVVLIYQLLVGQGIALAQSGAFSAIVIFELVTLYIIRSGYKIPFFSNKWLLISIGITIVLQLIIGNTPFFLHLFEITAITNWEWIFIAVASIWLWIACKLVQQGINGDERLV